MQHAHRQLPPWSALTYGKPAALFESGWAKAAGQAFAVLQGCQAGFAMPSTLHAFWDVFHLLSQQQVAIYYDPYMYPIAKWGMLEARLKGVPIRPFAHQQAAELKKGCRGSRTPVVFTDGWCPRCGKAAPLQQYLKVVRSRNGLLVVDDTQSLGVLGKHPTKANPYGYGGGGILKYLGLESPHILLVSSLAKAFGVPLTILSGSTRTIKQLKETSRCRVHNSPPSMAHLAAAMQALKLNSRQGQKLRQALWKRVRTFRNGLELGKWHLKGGVFPFQSLHPPSNTAAKQVYGQLRKKGIRCLLLAPHLGTKNEVAFILNSRQPLEELVQTTRIVNELIRSPHLIQFSTS
ncbi:MAG: pyridoxal phosphate-dependent aminotransferase family protein [Bacteroidetes bacterium]|nr:MAG: pyridoxal phosphate-dependent aminotransferase family protein [Bacteroidota bacterium]